MMRQSGKNGGEEDFLNRDFLQGKDLSKQDRVCRPPVPQLNDRRDSIEFMQIDVDYYTESPTRQVIESKCLPDSLTQSNSFKLLSRRERRYWKTCD